MVNNEDSKKRKLQINYVPEERFTHKQIMEKGIDPTTVNWE
jgi:hypothetical protein